MSDITTPDNGDEAATTPAKKKKEKTHWSEPFEEQIVKQVLQPLIRSVLEEGVHSMNNLIDKFQKRHGAAPTAERMAQWLAWINLSSLFAERPLIRLTPTIPQYQPASEGPAFPVAVSAVQEVKPGLKMGDMNQLIRQPDPNSWAPGVEAPQVGLRQETANGLPRIVIPTDPI